MRTLIVAISLACVALSGCPRPNIAPEPALPDYVGTLKSVVVDEDATREMKLNINFRVLDVTFEDGTEISAIFSQPLPILTPGRSYGVWRQNWDADHDNYRFEEMGLEKTPGNAPDDTGGDR